jgi:hypothetical protein
MEGQYLEISRGFTVKACESFGYAGKNYPGNRALNFLSYTE